MTLLAAEGSSGIPVLICVPTSFSGNLKSLREIRILKFFVKNICQIEVRSALLSLA